MVRACRYYSCWILLAAERRRGRGVGMAVWRMCCPAHTGNEVSCGVLKNVCVVWPCGCCVFIVVWVAGFRWASSVQSTPTEKWCPWVTGWCIDGVVLPLPSGPASSPLSCYNKHIKPYPSFMGNEWGVARFPAPCLTSLMWWGVVYVSFTCLTFIKVIQQILPPLQFALGLIIIVFTLKSQLKISGAHLHCLIEIKHWSAKPSALSQTEAITH